MMEISCRSLSAIPTSSFLVIGLSPKAGLSDEDEPSSSDKEMKRRGWTKTICIHPTEFFISLSDENGSSSSSNELAPMEKLMIKQEDDGVVNQ